MENLETVLPGGVQVTAIEPIRAKDGHITVHLRVVGPHDRAVDLVRNLEHSRRFLQPRIVGENSESTNGPNQRMEPVSASNRFDFDLLADYNPPTPEEAQSVRECEEGKRAARHGDRLVAMHSAHAPSGFQRSRSGAGRPPYTGPNRSQTESSAREVRNEQRAARPPRGANA